MSAIAPRTLCAAFEQTVALMRANRLEFFLADVSALIASGTPKTSE